MLFGFGRVPGCLGLGALFLWDEWREGRTDRLPPRWQSVRSGFWECEVWWSDGRVVGHQRCAGWLQGLSFLVMCREVVGHRRCVGCGWGEFFAICREGIGG